MLWKTFTRTVPVLINNSLFQRFSGPFRKAMATVCSAELREKIDEWIHWDKNEKTRSALQKLVVDNNVKELSKVLLNRLTFGTAGLRGKMDVGYNCMNDLVIIQTAQGILKYLEKVDIDLLSRKGIAVGYDGRHNSRRWAELTTAVFLHAGYPVRLFSEVNPTPFIPLAVSKYKCAMGIMVTASHNPKDDNGYKVYNSNGAQIIPPVDLHIQNSILKNLEPLKSSWDTSILCSSQRLSDPFDEVTNCYLALIEKSMPPNYKENNKLADLVFTYTAMHGVGYNTVKKVFDMIGINFVAVPEQRDPHPDFPTVRFPNPEEGKSSLDLAMKTANKNMSNIILANDPDADRFGVAEKNRRTGQWKVFTGNELGALFGYWMLQCYRTKHPNERRLNNVYMLSSTVSSMILKTMAKAEGFNFMDTLTGFKWLGNLALDLKEADKKVLLAFEEAIGFMVLPSIVDKDGISAAAHFATFASSIYRNKQTIAEKLEEIYGIYGQHLSSNSYYLCYDKQKIKNIFERLRNYRGPNMYPSEILNNKYRITNVRDLTTGYDDSQPDRKAVLPVSEDSQMITFNFDNGLVCTLRTSGTEPKVKYYTELCANPRIKDKSAIIDTLDEMIDAICEEFLEPEKNGLIPKAD